jgi:hypothetical protein
MHNESYSKIQMENAVRVVNAIERIPDNKQSLFLLAMESMMLGAEVAEQVASVKADERDSA